MATGVGDGLAVRLAGLWLGYVELVGSGLPAGLVRRSFVSAEGSVRPLMVVGCDLDGEVESRRLRSGVVWVELRSDLGPEDVADDAELPDEQTVLKWLEGVRSWFCDEASWAGYVQGLEEGVRRGFRVLWMRVGEVVSGEVDEVGAKRAPRVEVRVRVVVE
jgi:hypothetical protein